MIVSLLLVLVASPAAAQWDLGLELATTRYGGTVHNTSDSGPPSVRPGDATTIGLRMDRTVGRTRIGLRASYGNPGLTFSGSELMITDKAAARLFEGSALASFQVVGIGGGGGSSGAIRAEVGPALHLWKSGDELRKRLAALGAFAYEWPVVARFSGAIRLEGTISKSWFNAGDLPPGYERRVTWRYGVGLGLRYRL